MSDKKTVEINITGIVQGVGFRPFLYNLARSLRLKGYILNRGNAGVRLVLQGNPKLINRYISEINMKKPDISFIENIELKDIQNNPQYNTLEIKKSEEGRGISLTLPSDIAICEDCINDMRNKSLPKYYNYPFIACAVCGPRFTTVRDLPYDRERTTMSIFPFCKNAKPVSCIEEYSDFNNRRFHAQTFACSNCGPNYKLYNNKGTIITNGPIEDVIKQTSKEINDGKVIAVKGIGGVHLVCLANNDEIILKLRERKGERKNKPFAVMFPNIDLIEDNFYVSEKERESLLSYRKPIVLLERSPLFDNLILSDLIAPGLSNVGIMLPYSGIHYLLFDQIGQKPLVYTSGNKSNLPMAIENKEIFEQLIHLADIFLLHNRPIYQRADDSVLRIHEEKVKLIRRSRGYVPEYIPLPFSVDIPGAIATGPELTVTGAILRRNRIFPTQYIGNVTHLETYEFLRDAIFHMNNLLQIREEEIKFIACDAHPGFITTKFAQELAEDYSIPLFRIQHHHAHVLSLMVENKISINEKIVGIACDGVGYGDDGNVWGGEIFITRYNKYNRMAQLQYQPMIGGDRCTKFPARMVISILLNALGVDEAKEIFNFLNINKGLDYGNKELETMINQFQMKKSNPINQQIPLSSSTGRIFDSVSYLLGVATIKSYRGEPAMRLEAFARKGNPEKVNLEILWEKRDKRYIINTSKIILDIIELLKDPKNKSEDIAAKFQIEMGKTFAHIAIKIANENDLSKIGLTGGVAYNLSFAQTIKKAVINHHLSFLEHDSIPCGDGGISSGQLIGGLFQYTS